MAFLNYATEVSKAWEEPNPREVERMRPATSLRGGMYSLSEDMEVKAKLSTLARRLEELEMRNQHEMRTMAETPVPNKLCFIYHPTEHPGEHCPTVPSMRDMLAKQANVVGQHKPPTSALYSSTYNHNWRNHPNLS